MITLKNNRFTPIAINSNKKRLLGHKAVADNNGISVGLEINMELI
jgi:hypothetical protein